MELRKNYKVNKLNISGAHTIRSIATIALLTSLLVAVKYAFGFVPAVELTTLFVCIYAVMTPLLVSSTSVVSFILLTGAIYGMASWWVMYFPMFLTEVLLGWLFSKWLRKNNIIFSIWTGFWGLSLIFWYGLHDVVLFGKAAAIANMSTALITNVVEGVVNFTAGLMLFYPMKSLFLNKLDFQGHNYW